MFSKIKKSNKLFHIASDFSLNLLDHDKNKKVQRSLNIVYRNGMIPTINKPTRVTRKRQLQYIIFSQTFYTEFKKF